MRKSLAAIASIFLATALPNAAAKAAAIMFHQRHAIHAVHRTHLNRGEVYPMRELNRPPPAPIKGERESISPMSGMKVNGVD